MGKALTLLDLLARVIQTSDQCRCHTGSLFQKLQQAHLLWSELIQSLWCELVPRRGLRWQGELVARGWISRPLSWSSAFQVISLPYFMSSVSARKHVQHSAAGRLRSHTVPTLLCTLSCCDLTEQTLLDMLFVKEVAFSLEQGLL